MDNSVVNLLSAITKRKLQMTNDELARTVNWYVACFLENFLPLIMPRPPFPIFCLDTTTVNITSANVMLHTLHILIYQPPIAQVPFP
jgi:hypothetical protein